MPTIELVDNRIAVHVAWSEKEAIKAVPGASWDSNDKLWYTPATWAACVQLRGIFNAALTVGPELTAWTWREYNKRIQPAMALRTQVDRELSTDDKRYPYQACGIDFLALSSALLGDDVGLGKTMQALCAIDAADALPALVICPNSVKLSWAAQASQWFPKATTYVVHGSAAQRLKILKTAHSDPTALVIINLEALRQLSRLSGFGNTALRKCRECDRHGEEKLTAARCEVHPKILNTFAFRSIILDEAHRIKDPRSKQTRAVWAMGRPASVQRRWALTGTPIANHIGDLWSIMHFIAPDEWPTKSRVIDRYALTAWNPFGGIDIVGVRPETREEFYKILDPRFRRTPKQLVLTQLPDVIRSTHWVEMTKKQHTVYKELERDLITVMDNGEVCIAPNHLQKSLRLLQFASTYADVTWVDVPHDVTKLDALGMCPHCPTHRKMNVVLTEPSPKLDALEEILVDHGNRPIVVAAESRQLIELAAARLAKSKIPYGLITGAVDEYDRQRNIQRFRNDEIRVLMFTAKAGGTGVDGLQHSGTLVVLQRPWSMIENLQLEGRVNRIGSEKHAAINIIDIVTHSTVEETALFPRLREKLEQLELINRDRARLAAHTITAAEMFTLDERESRIVNSHLNMPSVMETES